jgi:hypothetical protein
MRPAAHITRSTFDGDAVARAYGRAATAWYWRFS